MNKKNSSPLKGIFSTFLSLIFLFFSVCCFYDACVYGEEGIIQDEGFESIGDISEISVAENEGRIYDSYVYVKELYILDKPVSISEEYDSDASEMKYYANEQKGELVEEYYTVMFSDASGDKYISNMVLNIEDEENTNGFTFGTSGNPVKVSAFLKNDYYEVNGDVAGSVYELLDESGKKYAKKENAEFDEYGIYTYVCETQAQYDAYVENYIAEKIADGKKAGAFCLVVAVLLILPLLKKIITKKKAARKLDEAEAPVKKAYDAEQVSVNNGAWERKGVYKEKPSSMETISAKMEKLKGKHSVNKSRSSSGMEFEDEMRK